VPGAFSGLSAPLQRNLTTLKHNSWAHRLWISCGSSKGQGPPTSTSCDAQRDHGARAWSGPRSIRRGTRDVGEQPWQPAAELGNARSRVCRQPSTRRSRKMSAGHWVRRDDYMRGTAGKGAPRDRSASGAPALGVSCNAHPGYRRAAHARVSPCRRAVALQCSPPTSKTGSRSE